MLLDRTEELEAKVRALQVRMDKVDPPEPPVELSPEHPDVIGEGGKPVEVEGSHRNAETGRFEAGPSAG